MFEFLNMLNNYESRKVARTEANGYVIDTCSVSDSDQPYETGISHVAYNSGRFIIVEMYSSEPMAQKGHEKWCEKFKNELPEFLVDVGTSELKKISCDGKPIIFYKKNQKQIEEAEK